MKTLEQPKSHFVDHDVTWLKQGVIIPKRWWKTFFYVFLCFSAIHARLSLWLSTQSKYQKSHQWFPLRIHVSSWMFISYEFLTTKLERGSSQPSPSIPSLPRHDPRFRLWTASSGWSVLMVWTHLAVSRAKWVSGFFFLSFDALTIMI